MGCDHIRALDSELLCEILKRVPDIDRLRNVPLVSHRLSQACRDPALWPDLHVQCSDFRTEAEWSSFLRWLVPRASGLQTLVFNNPENDTFNRDDVAAWELRVQDLMAVLVVGAPQLRSLVLRYPPFSLQIVTEVLLSVAFPLADLTRFSQLTSLTLGLGYTPIESAPLAAVLRGLPALEHLGLTCTDCEWDECLVSVATSCPQLTCLQIGIGYWEYLNFWDAPEEIGLLTNLVELTIENLCLSSLPDSISKLTSLQRLTLDEEVSRYDDVGIAVAMPSGLTACQQLSQLRINSDEASPVLADLKFLQQLEITRCAEIEPREMYWPKLTGLTELKLIFDDCYPDHGLEGLVGMTGLRKLTLVHAEAANLPEGPYLNALESICLERCSFGELPSNLTAATKLRHLELAGWHDGRGYAALGQLCRFVESFRALETLQLGPNIISSQEWRG